MAAIALIRNCALGKWRCLKVQMHFVFWGSIGQAAVWPARWNGRLVQERATGLQLVSQADQRGERGDLHFFHDLGAMHFDSAL